MVGTREQCRELVEALLAECFRDFEGVTESRDSLQEILKRERPYSKKCEHSIAELYDSFRDAEFGPC